MSKKQNRISDRILFTWLILAGFILLFIPHSLTSKLQFGFVRVFSKPLGLFRNFEQRTAGQQSSVNVVEAGEYLKLRNHLANNIQWLRQERQNVEKLSGLRSRSVWKGVDFVLADIITSFTGISRNEFVINRGRDDGLVEGQFAFNDFSVIGTVGDLDSRTACIELLSDSRSRVAVKIGELDLQCMMQGNGDGSASILLVSKKYKIKKGDIVYVQKKPGFLDVPMIAGTISRCKTDTDNPLLWEISVDPIYDMQDIKSITVIIMNSEEPANAKNDKAAT